MRFAVLLGPPGSGKGTVSAAIEKQTAFTHISTGARIRKEMTTPGSAIGTASKAYMDRSEFVPDEIAMQLVDQILEEQTSGTSWPVAIRRQFAEELTEPLTRLSSSCSISRSLCPVAIK